MTWLILAVNIVAFVSLAAACPHSEATNIQEFTGTNCSATNYNKSCCLYHADCKAVDGNRMCSCSPSCYEDGNCCEDIHCPSGKLLYSLIVAA